MTPSSSPPDPHALALRVVVGTLKGLSFELRPGRFILGRETDCDFQILEKTVSRRHCMLEWDGRGIWVRDNQSLMGTRLNGRVISEALIRRGDILELGHVALRLEDLEHVKQRERTSRRLATRRVTGPRRAPDPAEHHAPTFAPPAPAHAVMPPAPQPTSPAPVSASATLREEAAPPAMPPGGFFELFSGLNALEDTVFNSNDFVALIVMSDPELREVVDQSFEAVGFRALSAGCGQEALIHAGIPGSGDTPAFDLLVVSDQLEDMSGPNLIDTLRALGVAAPAVLIARRQTERLARELDGKERVALLMPPLGVRELLEAVDQVL